MHAQETDVFYFVLLGALTLLFIFLLFTWVVFKQLKKKNQLEKDRLSAEISLLETERARIAADLHDELVSLIAATKLSLQRVRPYEPVDGDILEKAMDMTDTTLLKIRDISHNIIPKNLETYGWAVAIRDLVQRMEHAGVAIRLDITESTGLSKHRELHLYRIVQEILGNAIRHGHASEIMINLVNSNDRLVLDISDNGKGFDRAIVSANPQGGKGLSNILRRAEVLGAVVDLDTSPGKGVRYHVEIPL